MLMNAKDTHVKMVGSARIWLRTIPVNAQENIWEGTVSTVSKCSCFYGCFIPCPISSEFILQVLYRHCIGWHSWDAHINVTSVYAVGENTPFTPILHWNQHA